MRVLRCAAHECSTVPAPALSHRTNVFAVVVDPFVATVVCSIHVSVMMCVVIVLIAIDFTGGFLERHLRLIVTRYWCCNRDGS